eukprot:TRINITY_DN10058_c0_g1_i1.p1 TRINITY_DN10058_c0_g1~~TRINITY_DN10058_c0_g1_i1.p1  ORF type:complete len:167 (+),score=60.95 TRINITY_DN10058_c0_g1_i1:67-501(+)
MASRPQPQGTQPAAKRRKQDLPGEVFAAGKVLPQDVTGVVGGYCGGLLGHLATISKAARAKWVDQMLQAFEAVVAEAPADAPVVGMYVQKAGQKVPDGGLDLLRERLPKGTYMDYGEKGAFIYTLRGTPNEMADQAPPMQHGAK